MVDVPVGTIDLEGLVVAEVERQLGRELTDVEVGLVSVEDFDVSFE